MQREPKLVAWRTPCHLAAGCGAFQRRGPTGGAAKGIPRKSRVWLSALIFPWTFPWSRLTANGLLAWTGKVTVNVVIDTAAYCKINLMDIGPLIYQMTSLQPSAM